MDVITVRLASSVRPRPCDPAGHELEVGESCLVDHEGTVEFGTVVAPVLANPHYAPGARLPRLLRRATVEDEEAFSRKSIAERDATAYCRERIAEYISDRERANHCTHFLYRNGRFEAVGDAAKAKAKLDALFK